MPTAVLLTGTNLGDRPANIRKAALEISRRIGKITGASSVRESEPWGFDAPEKFLNQVLAVETLLPPFQLLETILAIEKEMGRIRSQPESGASKRYASRIIDIDILFYDDLIIDHEKLTVPHPRILEREFVLIPLKEVLPDLPFPGIGKKMKEL